MSEENKKKSGVETENIANSESQKDAQENVNKGDNSEAQNDTQKVENKKSNAEPKEELKEELKDSEIIDLNNPDSEKSLDTPSNTEKASAVKKNKAAKPAKDKSSVEFLLAKKKKKKIRNWIIFGVIVALIIFVVYKVKNAAEQAKVFMEAAMSSNVETATVEAKTINKSVSATGQLLSADARTVTRNLNGVADIIEVNVAVGDYVEQGDVLVRFSTENVDKSISQTREDISTQKQQDAINKEDAERNYLNSYKSVATSIQEAAERVDRALDTLHEACNAYGDAKRELDKARNEGKDEVTIASLERAVDSAYQQQKTAQQNYDDAVENQAKTISDGQSNSLSNADSQYKKSQITADSQVKQLQRTLEKYEDSLDDYIVTAPISGVITAVNVSEGNSFSSGSVLTIQDLSRFEAEVLVDEYDIPSVKSAFNKANDRGEELEVVIKTEATEKNEYKGHVVSIDPTSTSTSTYTTSAAASSSGSGYSSATSSSSSTPQFKVKVMIDEPDEAFMMGMTAKVSILVEKSPENSLCIPYNAIEENANGEFFVQVVENADELNKPVDGIVVTKDDDSSNSGERKGGRNRGMAGLNENFAKNMQNVAGKVQGAKNSDEMKQMLEDSKPKTHDVKVTKIFDTDYYTAVVPVVAGELKAGDTVLINTDRSGTGNDFMNMMMGPY